VTFEKYIARYCSVSWSGYIPSYVTLPSYISFQAGQVEPIWSPSVNREPFIAIAASS
jgi:hypothetical protein